MHVYDVASGEVVGEPIPHVNLMGGSVAWRHDGVGLLVHPARPTPKASTNRCGSVSSRGAPDRVDLADGFAEERIAENFLSTSPDGRWVMDRVQRGDGGEWQIFLRAQSGDGAWWQVADIPDKCVHAVLGADALYLLSRRDAPRGKVLRLPLTRGATVADADEIVPASDVVIEDLAVTRGTVWVVDMIGGPQQVRRFDLDGGPLPPVEIPPVSSVSSYFARLARLGPDRVAWLCELLHRAARPGGSPPTGMRPDDGPPNDHALSICPATR